MRPAKSLRLTGFPLISLSVKSGACVPLVNNSVAYCKSRSASPAVCAKTFPAAITNNEIANNILFISKHYANLTKKSQNCRTMKVKCKLCATLWHPPSHSLLIIGGISHTIFLICHIGIKNGLPCTFHSSSNSSGKRKLAPHPSLRHISEFLMCHIRSENGLPRTFHSSSNRSGRRRANTGMVIAFESAKITPSNCSGGLPEAKRAKNTPSNCSEGIPEAKRAKNTPSNCSGGLPEAKKAAARSTAFYNLLIFSYLREILAKKPINTPPR